jgi:hypothetical protein
LSAKFFIGKGKILKNAFLLAKHSKCILIH